MRALSRMLFLGSYIFAMVACIPAVAGYGFIDLNLLNSQEISSSTRRWVVQASLRNNSKAQVMLANQLYFAPENLLDSVETDDEVLVYTASQSNKGDGASKDNVDGVRSASARKRQRQLRRRRIVREAAHWYEVAAAAGVPHAQNMLATFYSQGLHGFQQSTARAVLYHTLAADGGNVPSKLALAHYHRFGVGVPRSCQMAAEIYGDVADEVLRVASQDGEFLMYQFTDMFEQFRRKGPKKGPIGAWVASNLPEWLAEWWEVWTASQDSTTNVRCNCSTCSLCSTRQSVCSIFELCCQLVI